jgi:hypothetical protein
MYSRSHLLLVSVLCLAGLDTACRGRLPPTEPPRVSGEGAPVTRTNDPPSLGSLIVDGVVAPVGVGGTNVLPEPPGPGPAGSAGVSGTGSGGSAGVAVR